MRKKTFPHLGMLALSLFLSLTIFAQNRTVTGTVVDKDGAGVAGASVTVKGTNIGTNTSASGGFTINAPSSSSTLVISYVGYATQELPIGSGTVNVVLQPASANDLNEVVVVGYGTVRKKDVTGSVASVTAREFNTGQINNPEQLLQGKVPGLQITNSSGQPGAVTIVRIRGNNSIRSGNDPLYVVDGIPLDGRSARPQFTNSGSVGITAPSDPLLFINPNEISQIDILKDASASAIYGSRGANGVVIVTTKKGISGPAKVDFNSSVGIASLMKKVDVLDAAGYRAAIQKFGAPNTDSGGNFDPFDEILKKPAITQNYAVAVSGGNETGKIRASFFHGDQDGIIRKQNLIKNVANLTGQYNFFDKKLTIDFSGTITGVKEQIAPISQDAGSNGNLISLALIWNPTLDLRRNGQWFQDNNSGQVNPMALSNAYNDFANTTTLLGNVNASYKFTDWLEYRMLIGMNQSTGTRKIETQGWIAKTGGNAPGNGEAGALSQRLSSQTITHTLRFNKELSDKFSLDALAGYEYWKTDFEGEGAYTYGFNWNLSQDDISKVHYFDQMAAGKQANLLAFSYKDPKVEIQSYFARAHMSFLDRFDLTATVRVDGSSKFGRNNRYAVFPSVAASWSLDREKFMEDNNIFQTLKLRLGYGETGNQSFAADAPLELYRYTAFGSRTFIHSGNDDLKWETVKSFNAGLDFSVWNGRFTATIDYFYKKTTDPVIQKVAAQPQPPGGANVFANIAGAFVENKGIEIGFGVDLIRSTNFNWNFGANLTFLKNRFDYPPAGTSPFLLTGALHGQGTSGAFSEAIAHDQPINVFYLPIFSGFDKDGIGIYTPTPQYAGDPNPKSFIGINTDFTYKKWNLSLGAHGAFGNYLYNNTLMSVLNISNIVGGRNFSGTLVNSGESVSNPISTSSRFMEKGNYLKLHNATLRYTIGNIGKVFKAFNIYLAGNNLFVITKYNGFDPEVNVDKALNGIPSLGIDYIGTPSQRTVLLGVNFSL